MTRQSGKGTRSGIIETQTLPCLYTLERDSNLQSERREDVSEKQFCKWNEVGTGVWQTGKNFDWFAPKGQGPQRPWMKLLTDGSKKITKKAVKQKWGKNNGKRKFSGQRRCRRF